MIHELKTNPGPFDDISLDGCRFTIRPHDRPFEKGDTLFLREWYPANKSYSGRTCYVSVVHITPGGHYGLPEPEFRYKKAADDPGICVLGILLCEKPETP